MQYLGNTLKCECGYLIETHLESSLESQLDYVERQLTDSETYQCDECGRVYKLTITSWAEIYSTLESLEQIGVVVRDEYGNEDTLHDGRVDTQVEITDGRYTVHEREYVVDGGVLVDIIGTPILPNQMRLAI